MLAGLFWAQLQKLSSQINIKSTLNLNYNPSIFRIKHQKCGLRMCGWCVCRSCLSFLCVVRVCGWCGCEKHQYFLFKSNIIIFGITVIICWNFIFLRYNKRETWAIRRYNNSEKWANSMSFSFLFRSRVKWWSLLFVWRWCCFFLLSLLLGGAALGATCFVPLPCGWCCSHRFSVVLPSSASLEWCCLSSLCEVKNLIV